MSDRISDNHRPQPQVRYVDEHRLETSRRNAWLRVLFLLSDGLERDKAVELVVQHLRGEEHELQTRKTAPRARHPHPAAEVLPGGAAEGPRDLPLVQ